MQIPLAAMLPGEFDFMDSMEMAVAISSEMYNGRMLVSYNRQAKQSCVSYEKYNGRAKLSSFAAGHQKNFTSSPFISERSLLASELVPSLNHLFVSHFSPSTCFTMV